MGLFRSCPLENGLVRFETKTERALYAKVIASEANWMESQTCDRFITYLRARQDLDSFQEDLKPRQISALRLFFLTMSSTCSAADAHSCVDFCVVKFADQCLCYFEYDSDAFLLLSVFNILFMITWFACDLRSRSYSILSFTYRASS